MRQLSAILTGLALAAMTGGATSAQDPEAPKPAPAQSGERPKETKADEPKSRGLLQDLGSKASGASHNLQKSAAAESHKLESNAAKESHKLESNAAKESHKLQSNAAKESHKLQSNAAKRVVHFNKWWNEKVLGAPGPRPILISSAGANAQYYERLYEADRRRALASLGWTRTQIAIFERVYAPSRTFQATEYAALYDVLFDASYASHAKSYGQSGKPITDVVANSFPGTATQDALKLWGQYYGIKIPPQNASLRLDDSNDDSISGPVSGPGASDSTSYQDPQTGNVTQIDFGSDPSVINGPGSGVPSPTGAPPDGSGASGNTGSSPSAGGPGSGGNSSGTGGQTGQTGSGSAQRPTTGSTGASTTNESYADWSRNRFAQEYKQFGSRLRSQLTSLEEGVGKLWIRYGDKVRDFARDQVKEKVKDALGKLPGGNAAVKAMGVFNELLATRQALAAGPTLTAHPAAKLVAPAVDSESPEKFLEGTFAGPTDVRAIALSQKGYTVWKSSTGEWFYERNPRLSPSEYQTVIMPHGNPTQGNAKPTSVSDKTILIHYFEKLAGGKLRLR